MKKLPYHESAWTAMLGDAKKGAKRDALQMKRARNQIRCNTGR